MRPRLPNRKRTEITEEGFCCYRFYDETKNGKEDIIKLKRQNSPKYTEEK